MAASISTKLILRLGKIFIIGTNMQNFSTWGMEVEIIALASAVLDLIFYVFTEHNWLWYSHCIDNGEDEKSECAFYLSNEYGSHFWSSFLILDYIIVKLVQFSPNWKLEKNIKVSPKILSLYWVVLVFVCFYFSFLAFVISHEIKFDR